MTFEQIGEPIQVLAAFAGGGVEPVRFRWSGRTYRIDAINGRWIDRQGEGYNLHFSVQVGRETFAIHFASVGVQWWLDEVMTDG